MPKALRVCPCLGCPAHDGSCPELTPGGKCQPCRKAADVARGTAAERGYNSARWRARRSACLTRDPLCQCVEVGHDHGNGPCFRQSTDADHDPHERRDLVLQGVPDPDALEYLKGKCGQCHKWRTAATSPGGWNAR